MGKLKKLLTNPAQFFKDAGANRRLKKMPLPSNVAAAKSKVLKPGQPIAKKNSTSPVVAVVSKIQNAALSFANAKLTATVAVYFDGKMGNYYQIEQWFKPLEVLDAKHPVAFILRDPSVFNHLRQTTNFTAVLCPSIDDLTRVYETNNIKCILYVNNGVKNFQSLINGKALHVHINHGESDKISTVSNQSKAYDYVFVVSTAAIDKYNFNILKKDIKKYISIGRPQLEHISEIPVPDKDKDIEPIQDEKTKVSEIETSDLHDPTLLAEEESIKLLAGEQIDSDLKNGKLSRKVVLYAPTWEATHDSMNYTSLNDFGIAIVSQILADPRFYLIYKPHPNTGSRDATTNRINKTILSLLEENPKGEAITSGDINSIYKHADIAIFDNSAVAIDYLATNKPMLMTNMFYKSKVRRDVPAITKAARLISNSEISRLCDSIIFEIENDPLHLQRAEIKRYFLGDFLYTQGESTSKFIEMITKIIEEHGKLTLELSKMQEEHARKPRFTNQL